VVLQEISQSLAGVFKFADGSLRLRNQ
jgi:hypothetical protein